MPAARRWWPVLLLATIPATACQDDRATGPTTSTAPTTRGVAATTVAPVPTTVPPPDEIAIRLDRRTVDDATAGFEAVVRETLTDPRGWQRAGFVFAFRADAPFTVVLAEAPVVDRLCRPYDVYGRYSCQNGPVVALHADRWRSATPEWTGDLDGYRRMLVNHEVGHLIGQHHPDVQCPAAGQVAPVMAQQSTELDGCLPNPWPLDWEIRCAALRLEPLAPGYEPDANPRCGPDGPQP